MIVSRSEFLLLAKVLKMRAGGGAQVQVHELQKFALQHRRENFSDLD
jgi:hypothetical protein